jgi:hypothetical protein
VDRNCAEEKYYGAELGVTEVIQCTASVRAMIELAEGTYRVCHGLSRFKIGNRKYATKDPDCRNSS